MNARSHIFEFTLEQNQVEEVVSAILHTILFHRSTGKFYYQQQASYTIGTVGFEDVDCQFIDFTFVRCSSDKLNENVKKHVQEFKDTLKNINGHKRGQLCLEFYQRRKSPWPFPAEYVPWEIWILKLNVINVASETDRQTLRESVTDTMTEKVKSICEIVNQPEYVPKMPNEPDLINVFDDQYFDVQPYLHKVTFQTSEYQEMTVGSTVRKLLKDTFNY